jgi:hypothetical protein
MVDASTSDPWMSLTSIEILDTEVLPQVRKEFDQ